jgi:NAD(P)-dependent dehydrogenase (short-subunit alcohol dehydrogenase family)
MAAIGEVGGNSKLIEAELADLGSVAAAAQEVLAHHQPPAVLINNAGTTGRQPTVDGFDRAFGVNHLAHYLLTRLLLDRLLGDSPARVLTVASDAHYGLGDIHWEAASQPRFTLTGLRPYRQSKAANIAFTVELSRRLAGSGVVAVALHPGMVATGMWRRLPPPIRRRVVSRMSSAPEGARVTVDCVLNPELVPGAYYTPRGLATPAAYATDPQSTRDLWAYSEKLVSKWL